MDRARAGAKGDYRRENWTILRVLILLNLLGSKPYDTGLIKTVEQTYGNVHSNIVRKYPNLVRTIQELEPQNSVKYRITSDARTSTSLWDISWLMLWQHALCNKKKP